MVQRKRSILPVLCLALVLVAIGLLFLGSWQQGDLRGANTRRFEVMGTEAQLTVVVRSNRLYKIDRVFADARQELDHVNALMSTYIEASEVSQLNTAPPGEIVPLSPETLEVLHASRDFHQQTGGAFDITVRPLLTLWRDAAKTGQPPTPQQIATARQQSHWDMLELHTAGAVRTQEGLQVDLGGVAKGYAIDKATESMIAADCVGGLVNVGGDIRCFGEPVKAPYWRIAVRNPFDPHGKELFCKLRITEGAVCTSGNYFRYSEIEGKRFSHIVDPVSGKPVDEAPSVTVIAPTAMVADAWATALSVLGPEGLDRIPAEKGIEAMIVTGHAHDFQVHKTDGFDAYLLQPPPTTLPASRARPSQS